MHTQNRGGRKSVCRGEEVAASAWAPTGAKVRRASHPCSSPSAPENTPQSVLIHHHHHHHQAHGEALFQAGGPAWRAPYGRARSCVVIISLGGGSSSSAAAAAGQAWEGRPLYSMKKASQSSTCVSAPSHPLFSRRPPATNTHVTHVLRAKRGWPQVPAAARRRKARQRRHLQRHDRGRLSQLSTRSTGNQTKCSVACCASQGTRQASPVLGLDALAAARRPHDGHRRGAACGPGLCRQSGLRDRRGARARESSQAVEQGSSSLAGRSTEGMSGGKQKSEGGQGFVARAHTHAHART